jgi:hypothetical protein
MPRRSVPDELSRAAVDHVRDRHQEELRPEEIGRPAARRSAITLTWAEDEQLGLYFRCRRCPQGLDRYFIEVERQQPTERLARLAESHFQEEHGQPLPSEALWHEGNRPSEPLATFMPMVAQLGASIICHLCPQGMNRVFLTPAPHGDARRIAALLSERPELYEQTRGFSQREQAEYVEAGDRGELQKRDRLAGRRALGKAMTERKQLDAREQALSRLLLARAPDGKGIKGVVEELNSLSLEDPVEFACQLATVIPGFAELVGNIAREQLATAVARHLGCSEGLYPRTSETELWELWAAIRP